MYLIKFFSNKLAVLDITVDGLVQQNVAGFIYFYI